MKATPLLDRWRAVTVSRFGKAILDECEKHGGIAEYCEKIGTKTPTMGTWVRNTSKPGYTAAMKMLELSPVLKEHLDERGCFDAPARDRRYQRKQAPVPLTRAAQTTTKAREHHQRAMTDAERRALKHKRLATIAKVDRKKRRMDKKPYTTHGTISHAHYNPCTHGGYGAVVDEIGNAHANVAVPTTYGVEES